MKSKKAYVTLIIILMFSCLFFLYKPEPHVETTIGKQASVKAIISSDNKTSIEDAPGSKHPEAPSPDFNCRIIKTEPIVIYSPVKGKIQYLVKEESIIQKGDVVAVITGITPDKKDNAPPQPDIQALENEIESQKVSIKIAHTDMENIQKELGTLNAQFMDARYAYSTGQADFENKIISQTQLNELKKNFERISITITQAEKMLDGKYTAIESYKSRISELETMALNSKLSENGAVEVMSDFDGRINIIFFSNDENAEEGLPLLTISASNIAFIEFLGQIPFSADGKDVSLDINNHNLVLQGKLKFIGYKQEKGPELTSAWIIFSKNIDLSPDHIGKKAIVSFQSDS